VRGLDTSAPVVAACEWVFGRRPREEVLSLLANAGCGGIEVAGHPEREDRARLSILLDGAGLSATGITAMCRWPTAERDLAHDEAEARRRAVSYYCDCVDLALELGAPMVAVIPVSVGRLKPLTTFAREWDYAVDGVRAVADYAGERGVDVAIEAINRYESYLVTTGERAAELAEAVERENVGVVLDLFHMNLEEASPERAVAAAAPLLRALHLADSNRRGLGHGHLDFAACVRAALGAGFAGPFTLEFTAPGPDPFSAEKEPAAMVLLDDYTRESVAALAPLLDPRTAG
jgi:D-psicose/D-tagatose/L-ribulose 3-epimerase